MHTIECFLTLAAKHGERAAPHHRVQDLEDFLRAMWEILTPTQRWGFAQSERVREIVEGAGVDVAELPECADPPDSTPWCEQCQSYHGPKLKHIERSR